MKKYLYTILSCALLLFAATTSVHAEDGIKETRHYTICPGDTMRLGTRSVVVSEPTILYDTLIVNSTEEDSIIAYVVNVYPPFVKDEYKRLQKGDSYVWQDTTIADPGVYVRIYHTSEGCDSIYRLHVTQPIDSALTFTLCEGQSITFNGRTYSNAGVYEDILSGDTVYTITIVKNPSREYVQYGILDRTHPYYWQYMLDGETKTDTLWDPGRYVYTTQNPETGCNDTWVLVLTRDETQFHSIETVTICENEEFDWRGHKELNRLGVGQTIHYYDRYRTVADQDSIYELILTVNPVLRSVRTIPFCGSIEWNGKTYTESETLVDSLTSVQFNCDSIVTTILKKGTPVVHKDTISILGGESLNWHGQMITIAGDYTDIRHSSYGCDTTFMLHVTLTEPAHTMNTRSEWVSICQGDGLDWHDKTYYNSGIYYDTIKAGDEIDSLYILYLRVNPKYELTERVTFLSFPTTYREQTIPQPGKYVFQYQSSLGCDSIITSYIDQEVYEDVKTVTICPGQTYIWDYDGETYTVGGKYTKTEKTADGLTDSVRHVLNLKVNYIPETSIEHTMCKGAQYTFAGETLTESGVYRHTYHKEGGCDSVVVLSLNVLNPDTTYLAIQRNQGDSYVWDGETIRDPGIYFHYYTNRFGCDSVSMLQFTFNQIDTIEAALTVCPNELPYEWNGISANQTKVYTKLVQEPSGSYTYYVLDLTVREVAQKDTAFVICEGSSVTYNGVTYDEAGHYRTYISCDTLMNVHISVNLPAVYETHGTVTAEHGFTWTYRSAGQEYTAEFPAAGTYEFEDPNPETGCNDIYRLILTQDATEYHFEESLSICEGDDFSWHGLANLSSITGTHTYTDAYKTRSGKDSIYTLHLTVTPIERTVRSIIFCDETVWKGKSYTNSAVVYDTIVLSTGCYRIERINLDKANSFYSKESKELPQGTVLHWHGQNITTDGTYYDYGSTIHGCDSTYEILVTIIPAAPQSNQYAEEISACEGDTIVWRGKDIWRSGVYVDTVYASGTNQIDSIFSLTFTAWPAPKDTVFQHLYTCSDGAAIRYQGKDYYQDETVISHLYTIHGCDSIVKVYMHFNTALSQSRTDTIVDTELPYTWTYQLYDEVRRDTVLTKSGTYTHIVSSEGGCTNKEELVLVVLKTYLFELDTTVCETKLPFLWRDKALQHAIGETKQYEDVFKTVNNTDSIYRLNLTIDPAPKRVERISICENKDTMINGKSYFNPIDYPVGLVFRDTVYKNNGANECDSIIYYEITKTPQRHIIEERILHQDESFEWHGMTIEDPVTKVYTIEDEIDPETGCEIIYQISVIAEDRTSDAICETELPYTWAQNGQDYTTTGLYTDTTFNAEGKITGFFTLDLRVDTVPQKTEYYYICYGHSDDIYGRHFGDDPTKTDYVESFKLPYSVPGSKCTGELTVVVTVSSEKVHYETVILRDGETLDWNKHHITTGGEYRDTAKTEEVCDSISILYVIQEQPEIVTICKIDTAESVHIDKRYPYFWKQNQQYYNTSGIYTDTIFDAEGKISEFHALYLTITQPYDTTVYIHSCDVTGAMWRDEIYTKDTTFVDRVEVNPYDPAHPCDSVFHVNIKIDKSYSILRYDTICEHNLPYVVGQGNRLDSTYSEGWLPPFRYLTSCGCDSVVQVHLTIIPDFEIDHSDSIFVCEESMPLYIGDTIHPAFDPYRQKVNEWQGKWIGVKISTDTIIYNCGKVDSMHIIMRPHQSHIPEYEYSLCKGDSVQLFWPHKDTWIKEPGDYMDTVPTISSWEDLTHHMLIHNDRAFACDSIVKWKVRYADTLHVHLYEHIRQGDTYRFNDSILTTTGVYDSIGYYQDIIDPLQPTLPGVSSMDSAHHYCKAVYSLHLTVDPVYRYGDTIEICHPANREYTYTFNDDQEEHFAFQFQTPEKDTAILHMADSTMHLSYEFYDHFYDLVVYYKQQYYTQIVDSICYGDSIQFDRHFFEGENNKTEERYVHDAGIYYDTLTALNGCDSIIELRLFVRDRIVIAPQSKIVTDRELPYEWVNTWREPGAIQDTTHTDSLFVSGEYTYTMPNRYGCDSTVVLNFTVHQTHVFRDTLDICEPINTTFTHVWSTGYEQEYTTPLADDTVHYYDTLVTFYPLDSIYDLFVHFHRTYETHVYDTICAGDSVQISTYLPSMQSKKYYKETGIYRETVPSFFGCDSVITLHLQVWPGFPTTYNRADIADVDTPYIWQHTWWENGSLKTQNDSLYIAGEYSRKLTNIHGCDSIDSLTLYIHPTYRIWDDTINICEHDVPYQWRGLNNISSTGDYTYGEQTVEGYDSIHYVHINVWKQTYDTIYATICEGDSIRWGMDKTTLAPRFVHTAGLHNDTTINIHGCDQVNVLNLTVHPRYYNEWTIHIADVDTPYVWKHFNHNGDSIGVDSLYATDKYGFRFETKFACDSIDSLNLVVHNTYKFTEEITICERQTPYTWQNRNDITESGTYYYNPRTKDGYDSIYIATITVMPTVREIINEKICKNNLPFRFHGKDLMQGGIYIDTLASTASGCDSIVELHLTVNDPYYHYERHDIYEGETYNFFGQDCTTGGTYTHSATTPAGCDSITEILLVVHPLIDTTATVCSTDLPFVWVNHWNGKQTLLHSAGLYHDDTTYVNGERTFWSIQLNVIEPILDTIRAAICEGTSYPFVGKDLKVGGIYRDTTQGSNGCDSITTLILTVNQPYYSIIREDILEGNEVEFYGTTYGTSGTYTHYARTEEGCDSTTILQLTVHPQVDTTINVCDNDLPVLWHNRWSGQEERFYTAGLYRNDTTINSEKRFYGIQVNVNKQVFDTIRAAICEGTTYEFNGEPVTAAGIYRDTLRANNGCDSIVTLILTINKPYYNYKVEHIFEGQQVTFFDTVCNTTGTYYHYARTEEGCDSTSVLQLIVHQLVDTVVTVCSTDLPYLWINKWDGTIIPLYTAGTYRNDTTYVNGERMYYGLQLIVKEPTDTTLYREICEGDHYNFNGQDLMQGGEYRDTIRRVNGCDSVIILHLNVLRKYYNIIEKSIYQGDSVLFQGTWYKEAGTYPYTIPSSYGCDSVIELRLTVNRLYDDSVSVCANNLPYYWYLPSDPTKYMTINESGIYRDTVVSTEGRQTTIGLKVTVLPIAHAPAPINVTICEGDFYKFGESMLSEQGTYYDTLVAANGCDSVVMLALQVQPLNYQSEVRRIYEGDSVLFNGTWYKESGVYEHRELNANGCMDTYQLILTVLKEFRVDTTAYVCANDLPFVWRGIEYSESGDYSMPIAWTDSSRVVKTLHLTVREAFYSEEHISICYGNIFVINNKVVTDSTDYFDTIPARNGCDSIIRYIISVYPKYEKWDTVHISDKQTYNFDGRDLSVPGDYERTTLTNNGCDSIVHLHLEVHPSYLFKDSVDICQPDSYSWANHGNKVGPVDPITGLHDDQDMIITESGVYYDRKLTHYGFDSIYELKVTVHPSYEFYEQYEIGEGEQLTIHGMDITTPGTYTDHLLSMYGCDSIYKIVVNPRRTREFTWNKTICQGDYIAFPDGSKKTETGNYTYYSENRDTVIYLSLTVIPVNYTEERIVIPSKYLSEAYLHTNGKLYQPTSLGANVFEEKVASGNKCDNVHRLILYVTNKVSDVDEVPLCEGESITVNGKVITQPGLYPLEVRSKSSLETDSLHYVEVYLSNKYDFPMTFATICDDDSIVYSDNYGTKVYKVSGLYEVKLKTVDGCDSIHHLNLTVNPTFYKEESIRVLDDELPYNWEGEDFTMSGDYTHRTLVNECDDTHILHLEIVETQYVEAYDTICNTDTLYWRGKAYYQTGDYYDTYRDAVNKHKTVYTLHLQVVNPTTIVSARAESICADDESFDIVFNYSGHRPATYSIYFDVAAKQEGFADLINQPLTEPKVAHVPMPVITTLAYENHPYYIKPNTYKLRLVLDNGVCGLSKSENLELEIKYPSWIIEQCWNDVVVPLKQAYNGGYEFSQVDWIVNGVRQQNNGKGYLQHTFSDGDEVVMMATRKGENYAIETCPLTIGIKPNLTYDDPILVYPTQAPRARALVKVKAPRGGEYELYNSTGLIISSGQLISGENELTLPATSGIYFIRTKQDDEVKSHKVLIY